MENYSGWYAGNLCENDVAELRSRKQGVQYFEDFKGLLSLNGIEYDNNPLKDFGIQQNAHVILYNNKAIYYTSGNGWWGVQKGIIHKLNSNGIIDVLIILSNDSLPTGKYYWVIKLNGGKKVEETGRFMFRDTKGKLSINNIGGQADGYFCKEEKLDNDDDIITRL